VAQSRRACSGQWCSLTCGVSGPCRRLASTLPCKGRTTEGPSARPVRMVADAEVIHANATLNKGLRSSSGLLPANLPLFTRSRLQLPIPLSIGRNVVQMLDVALHQTTRVFRPRRSQPYLCWHARRPPGSNRPKCDPRHRRSQHDHPFLIPPIP